MAAQNPCYMPDIRCVLGLKLPLGFKACPKLIEYLHTFVYMDYSHGCLYLSFVSTIINSEMLVDARQPNGSQENLFTFSTGLSSDKLLPLLSEEFKLRIVMKQQHVRIYF